MTKEELNVHIQRLLACAEELNKTHFVYIDLSYGQCGQNVSISIYGTDKDGLFDITGPIFTWNSLHSNKSLDLLPEAISKIEQLTKGDVKE